MIVHIPQHRSTWITKFMFVVNLASNWNYYSLEQWDLHSLYVRSLRQGWRNSGIWKLGEAKMVYKVGGLILWQIS